MPSACSSLNIWVGDSSNNASTVPELAISQWPNLRPTFHNMAWISYEWMENNVTINTFDPNFFGGMRCGKYNDETCVAIIGVLGYCSSPNTTEPFQYTLVATLSPAHKIYGEPQVQQSIAARGSKSYEFCIAEDSTSVSGATDTAVELIAHSSSCNCGNGKIYFNCCSYFSSHHHHHQSLSNTTILISSSSSITNHSPYVSVCVENQYTNLEMFVSRRKPSSTENDLVWHISHFERLTAIKLLGNDSDTRSGSFYVTVYGWCTEDAQCSGDDDLCTCAPCSNLQNNASYTLKVSGEMDYDYSRDSLDYLDPCTSDGTCSSTTCPSSSPSSPSSSSDRDDELSRSEIIGIVFGCFAFLLLVVVGLYFARVRLFNQQVL